VRHLRSNAIAYLALFLALGGGTAVAVSGALRADTVDGLSAARFSRSDVTDVATTKVLEVAGMRVRYSCVTEERKRGADTDVTLDLRTTADGARAELGFTTGSDPGGSSFVAKAPVLDQGQDFDLDQGRAFGSGNVTFTGATGRVVSLDYAFNAGSTKCTASGVALGG
jgi:hypothetical protein